MLKINYIGEIYFNCKVFNLENNQFNNYLLKLKTEKSLNMKIF